MTRTMNSSLECPTCKCQMSMETRFERWMRDHRILDSREGLVRFDLDVLLHRYMVKEDGFGRRDIQALMFLEVKTYGATMSDCQRDTMHLLNQVLRNRRKNINGRRDKYNAKDHVPLARAMSTIRGEKICLRMFGGHLLTFEGSGPEDSEWIRWDKTEITADMLLDLLRFERDPDAPHLMLDIRRRTGPAPLLDYAGKAPVYSKAGLSSQ